ncbi:M20 metallopeptidase family protein [Thalassobacillus pellis]|uniref:M20 metallopeptidase family protein n=1 Tax=Thalassobacillus pellis TaxID=748008 RepID=UPI00195FAEFA|nr:amidohydrolase [Thalassobacillus pellis]MBM7553631.1 amidohydrolase [Thalassobacillus pellis]
MQIKHDSITLSAEFLKPELLRWRRHLHRHPELSFKEIETSRFVRKELEAIGGLDIRSGIGGHGIVATLFGGEGPVIGLRADMDALPIEENSGVEFQSENKGIMHACGHDAHTAMLLGAVKLLAEEAHAGNLNGTIKFIFQPAEENSNEDGLTGAPLMLGSGVLDDIQKIIALHVCPWHHTGEIQVCDGPSMANIDNFHLTIKGTGGHGGYPHLGTDPVWMSSYFLQGLYSLMSRKVDPLEAGTISVGEIHGGKSPNVIPDHVVISGTMRSLSSDVRTSLVNEINQLAEVISSLGGTYELKIEKGEPALNNNSSVNEVIKESARHLYPNVKIHERPFGMGGEDFSHMTNAIPGAMFFLGCWKKGAPQSSLHTSDFQLDEHALPIGVSILVESTHRLLKQGGK